jgi:hypothetical protein
MAGLRAIALGAVLGLIAAHPTTAQQQIDLYGVTSATLEWSPASGPVTGYYVIVARNGGTPSLQGVATQTRATVASSYGEVVMVQVAAFDEAGLAGPVSQPSSSIRFNPPPPTSDPTTPSSDPDLQVPSDPSDPSGGSGGGGTETPGETPVATRFDFSGDGLSDLLLRDPASGALVLWKMEGNQVVEQGSLAHLPPPWNPEESGDFDGDGTADLLWRNASTGQLVVWLVRAGVAAGGSGLDLGAVTSEWTVAGRGDFDGDGRDDIALARPQRGAVDLLLMNGNAIASRVTRNAPSDRWRVVATPDADGDGTAELVWENVDSHALSIEHMSAPGQVTPLVAQAGAWRVFGSGDLDGDGRDDLLVRQSGRVQVWLLDGDRARVAGVFLASVGTNWAYRGLGDFDGDGRADAFWHDASGVVEIWFATEGGWETAFASKMAGDDVPAGDVVE